jgi:D-alanyl-D-alanine carboxypeptidase/D-alanyl-D-alanine-endopeptidase (penicillin-binding protein 4)
LLPAPFARRLADRKDTVTLLNLRTGALSALLALAPHGARSEPAPAPAGARGAPGAKELGPALAAMVEGSALSSARTGIFVAAVETGEVFYARDPDALLNPASVVKLFTSAAALARLGTEYRFSTELLAEGAGRGGEVKALHVRGRGDPSLVTERLWVMAGDLAHLGVREVGELVLDDGWFDGERTGPGYDQEDGDRSYLAPVGALSLNFNSLSIHVAPGERRGQRARVELEPASDLLEVENRAMTVARGGHGRVKVSSSLRGGKQRIVVEGRIALGSRAQVIRRRVDEPALYFGHTLKALLKLRGVRVGRVRTGKVPEGARLLYVSQSDALADIVRRLNKTSNNFIAEQLLKTLGAEVKGAPGSWPKGVAAVEEFLAEVGIPRGSYVMRNGSGLNDTNRFSARQIVTLLRAMWTRSSILPEYLVSLPVAGRDGTIRWRMEGTEAAGRLRAKTGTLEGVTSLSGFVQTAGGRTLAFAVLVNDAAGRGPVVRAMDAVGGLLAASGGPPAGAAAGGEVRTVAAALKPSGEDLARSARTYYVLGRAGDPRNEPFLRAALRTETDPALRIAAAECVYLSEPDGDAARRTFLDALAADPQAPGRLWAALAGDAPGPVIASLADLAAEAEPDAIQRLIELVPASAAEPGLAAAVADALAEVAASAPEELVQTLRATPAATAEAAVGGLGAGLSRSEKDHPFPAALRTMAEKEDGLAAYARALIPTLDQAILTGETTRAAPALVPAGGAGPAAPVR